MIKNALISGWVAGLVCLYAFGFSVAFGQQDPAQAPPGGLAHPTFSSVDIIPGGYISAGGIMSPEGDLILTKKIPGSEDVGGDSAFIRITDNPTDLGDSVIFIGSEVPGKNITITTGDGGKIFLNDPVEALSLKIFSGLDVSGDIKSSNGSLIIEDGSFSISTGSEIIEQGNLNLTNGSITLDAGDLNVTAGKVITNTIEAADDHTPLTFNSQPKFEQGAIFSIAPSFPTEMDFQKINLIQFITNPLTGGTGHVKVDDPEGLYVTADIKLDGQITDMDDGDVNIGEDLTVSGKIKANAVGKFVYDPEVLTVPATSYWYKVNLCPSGKVVACHIDPVSYSGTALKDYWGMHAFPYFSGSQSGCKGRAYNGASISKTFNVTAVCFDPTIN